jgi:CIC family chloride channel protein
MIKKGGYNAKRFFLMMKKFIKPFKNFCDFIKLIRGHISLPEPVFLGLAATIVGLLTGIGVWVFKQLINLIQIFMFDTLDNAIEPFGRWTIALLPMIGGLVVGLISCFIIGKERYHGLPGIIEACALAGGRLPFAKMPMRVTTAAISIGSGASVGPEDPSVQVGANIGSMIGQWLRFSEERLRILKNCLSDQ